MNLEIKRAFTTPFGEEKWYLRLIFPFLVTLLAALGDKHFHLPPILLVAIFVALIPLSLILSGFYLQFEHNEIHSEESLLPVLKDKWLDYLILGLKVTAIFISFLFVELLLFLPLVKLFKIETLTGTIFGMLLFVLMLFVGLILSFATSSLADTFELKYGFNLSRILSLIPKVIVEIIVYLILCVILAVAGSAIASLLKLNTVGILLTPIVTVIVQFITVDLKAQVYKIAKFRLENLEG